MEYTTIAIDRETHEELSKLKREQESFDGVLRRLVTERT